ncbi:SDR family NAD(P)-dependent oxidoreductase [Glycomyces salinus]|uniref:SDR family NAD(P)-dependent oxidoreductase n=1 Tax=Glycomyces salinus TaxID=980294 RepID=UPI0018EBC84D|nr:SDR family NAD(P)-dependent oxidoreductase [Glycomyces salinus]
MDEPTDAELEAFDAVVAKLRSLPADDRTRLRAEQVAASFVRDGRRRRKKSRAQQDAATDGDTLASTATGNLERRPDAPLAAPGRPGTLARPRRCYICKRSYRRVDGFYHQLCPPCASENSIRRQAGTDLTGRSVLLTGGRVKIGFELALMMLRDGAEVTVTTRFPNDAVRRFHSVPGSEEWSDRLEIVGIDLRDPRQVLGLCDRLLTRGRPLDILVNNAAQTLRRPAECYQALIKNELAALPARNVWSAPGYRTPEVSVLPAAALDLVASDVDAAGLLPDDSTANSWSARLGALDPAEILETYLVNAFTPTLLCDRLLPLLTASSHSRRYIVNVTAVEGRFAVRNKTARHPQTNMPKAALNMLTRTSGPSLVEQGVYMCAVDTGWITDENPAPKRERMAANGFRTPLDIVDGAARVYDPIVRGEAGSPVAGVLLKDYREVDW